MASVYTETFLRNSTAGNRQAYTVPAGHRAIVTSCVSVNGAADVGLAVDVRIAGTVLWLVDYQASVRGASLACRAVAYAGEVIDSLVALAGCSIIVSGYLFSTTSLRGPAVDDAVDTPIARPKLGRPTPALAGTRELPG